MQPVDEDADLVILTGSHGERLPYLILEGGRHYCVFGRHYHTPYVKFPGRGCYRRLSILSYDSKAFGVPHILVAVRGRGAYSSAFLSNQAFVD